MEKKGDLNDLHEELRAAFTIVEDERDFYKNRYDELFDDFIRALYYTQHQSPCVSESISGKPCFCGLDKLLERASKYQLSK